jgi:hypothetical protein
MKAEHAGLLSKGPLAVIRHMIPLPEGIELATDKIVIVNEGWLGFLGMAGVRF